MKNILYLDSKEVKKWEKLLKKKVVNLDKENIDVHDGLVASWTIKLSNEIEADLKICTSDNKSLWSEVVWFKNGVEISHTDISDSLLGEWSCCNDNYSIYVEAR